MQEPQLDKVVSQGFLFVKAIRIQNWSEQECRTVCKCLQIYCEINLKCYSVQMEKLC